LAHYDLGTLHSSVSSPRGLVNETAFVETSKGRFVVRRNHRQHTEEAQRYRHRLISWLHAHDVPAPSLIPTRDGDTLLTLEGRTYEVSEYVQGEAFNASQAEQIAQVGVMLARYHRAVREFPAPPDPKRLRYSPQSLMALNEVLMKRDFFMGDLSETLSWYDGRAARLRKLLPDQQYERLPHLPIHGDIHRDNVLFDQDQVAALLDYDQVAWDTPVADIVDALVAFASIDKPKAISWGVFAGPLDETRAAHLLEGYAREASLSTEEVRALPKLLEVHWLQGEMGRVFSTPEADPDYHLSVLDQGLALSYWLNERNDQLVDQWSKILCGSGKAGRLVASAA
jgi:homoserine kinase type II